MVSRSRYGKDKNVEAVLRRKEYLRMQYEETANTLRNWDSLLFKPIASLIIASAAGALAVVARNYTTYSSARDIIIEMVIIILFLSLLGGIILTALYLAFQMSVATQKIIHLANIEKELKMCSIYGDLLDGNKKLKSIKKVKILLIALIVIITVFSLIMIFSEFITIETQQLKQNWFI
jgi:hypothetical protein